MSNRRGTVLTTLPLLMVDYPQSLWRHVDSQTRCGLVVNAEGPADPPAHRAARAIAGAADPGADGTRLLILNALQKDSVGTQFGGLRFHSLNGFVHVLLAGKCH